MGEKGERLARAMALISQGDIKGFGDTLLSEAVTWHWSGQSSVSGTYVGRDAALGLLRGFSELTGNRLSVEPLEILEGENYLMSFTRVRADRDGMSLDVVMADAMRFGPDGKVVEYWTLSNDQRAVDAFIG
jgi:hypothetical protein